jgi:plastocyanin domain-containing protein
VKWIIDAQQLTGCNNAIKVPSLGLEFSLKPGLQTIEFTPTKAGNIPWSCWMGMIRGSFIVKDGVDTTSQKDIQKVLEETPATTTGKGSKMGRAGGGCGCGMM